MHINKLKKIVSIFIYSQNQLLLALRDNKKEIAKRLSLAVEEMSHYTDYKYVLVNDILNKEDEEIAASKGDVVTTYEDQAPTDTILGVDIFPVIHFSSNEKIFVSLDDIEEIEDDS